MSKLILSNGIFSDIKMVVFDKDGTLIDVHNYWCSMITFRADFLVKFVEGQNIDTKVLYNDLVGSMGINQAERKMKSEGPVGIKPRSYIEKVALDTMLKYTKKCTGNDIVNIFDEVDEYSKTKLSDIVKLLPGVKKLLEDLKRSKTLMSIATTDRTSRAIAAMKELNLDHYFSNIVGADLVENAKPEPDLVNYIINQHGLKRKQVVVFGDSMPDFEMAQNANCMFIGVKTGLYCNNFNHSCSYLVDTLEDVKVNDV